MKMVGIQAVYLIALYIFQYMECIRHLFITALENDTKYLRRKLSRLFLHTCTKIPGTQSHIIIFANCQNIFRRLQRNQRTDDHQFKRVGGMGWLPVHFKSIYTIYLLQLPPCVYLVNDIINNCLCRIPLVPCPCYMIYAVGQPFENC